MGAPRSDYSEIEGMQEKGDIGGLIAELSQADVALRIEAAKALASCGDPRAVEPLIASLREEETGIMVGVRRYFAEAMGELADPCGREPLRTALEDEDETVREAAARALEKLEEKGAASD